LHSTYFSKKLKVIKYHDQTAKQTIDNPWTPQRKKMIIKITLRPWFLRRKLSNHTFNLLWITTGNAQAAKFRQVSDK